MTTVASIKRGRRPVLDEVKRAQICAILAVGGSRSTAAAYVGCAVDTIRKTAVRDDEFAAALRHAESRHEVFHVRQIQRAARQERYWRAAAWILERLYPDRYAARKPNTLTLKQLSHALVQFAEIIIDEVKEASARRRILARIEKLAGHLDELGGARRRARAARKEKENDERREPPTT